jgi:FKBP-type peptidyl-prolyl cis-trans isomerase
MKLRSLIPALVIALALGLAACGGDDKKDASASASTSTEPAAEAPATTETTPSADATKPVVKKPKGKAPKKLVVKDLKNGSGPAAQPGQTVTVQYVGVLFKTGKQFDASWDRGQPFSFPLGAGQVIKGWDEGVAGMKVGGRRELIIPADLAYGDASPSPDIPPNSALVFVVDLLGVQ